MSFIFAILHGVTSHKFVVVWLTYVAKLHHVHDIMPSQVRFNEEVGEIEKDKAKEERRMKEIIR